MSEKQAKEIADMSLTDHTLRGVCALSAAAFLLEKDWLQNELEETLHNGKGVVLEGMLDGLERQGALTFLGVRVDQETVGEQKGFLRAVLQEPDCAGMLIRTMEENYQEKPENHVFAAKPRTDFWGALTGGVERFCAARTQLVMKVSVDDVLKRAVDSANSFKEDNVFVAFKGPNY